MDLSVLTASVYDYAVTSSNGITRLVERDVFEHFCAKYGVKYREFKRTTYDSPRLVIKLPLSTRQIDDEIKYCYNVYYM